MDCQWVLTIHMQYVGVFHSFLKKFDIVKLQQYLEFLPLFFTFAVTRKDKSRLVPTNIIVLATGIGRNLSFYFTMLKTTLADFIPGDEKVTVASPSLVPA